MRAPSLAAVLALACTTPSSAVPAAAPDSEAGGLEDEALVGTWELQVRRTAWSPRDVDYVLTVDRDASGELVGAAAVDLIMAGRTTYPLVEAEVSQGQLTLALRSPELGTEYLLTGQLSDGVAEGIVDWTDHNGVTQQDLFHMHRRPVRYLDGQLDPADERLPVGNARDLSLDERALLDRVVLAAEDARSDALVVVVDGEIVVARWFGGPRVPRTLQSITKPVSSLALAWLIEEGAVAGLDAPLSTWFPELDGEGLDSGPTLRQVLAHTSGLDAGETQELNEAPDQVAYARAATQVDRPGRTVDYNNRAMQLVSGIVREASGEDTATYLGRRLFEPLGITSVRWGRDAAGNAPTYGGISMDALDLAIIGQVVADGGRWQGEQLVPEAWLSELLDPEAEQTEERRLAWLLLRIHTYGGGEPRLVGVGHSGSGGQRLLVYPEAGLVVARQVSVRRDDPYNRRHDTRDSFGILQGMASHLALARLQARDAE